MRDIRVIVIVAPYHDPHADSVSEQLLSAGVPYLRVDLGAVYRDFDIIYTEGEFSLLSRHGLGSISADSIRSVWWRRTSSSFDWKADADQVEVYNVVHDWFLSLPSFLYPLGHPYDLYRAENKILQLSTAHKVELPVPPLMFSNDLKWLCHKLVDRHEYVSKSLTQVIYKAQQKDVYFETVAWTGAQIKRHLEAASEGACILQDRVRRNFDVRVNIFPASTIAAKIDLTDLPDDEVDWRSTTMRHRHELIDVPSEIEAKCRSYLQILDIDFGAFDFIVDLAGKWWFLECNPSGQWLWIQILTGENIAEHFAKSLAIDNLKRR